MKPVDALIQWMVGAMLSGHDQTSVTALLAQMREEHPQWPGLPECSYAVASNILTNRRGGFEEVLGEQTVQTILRSSELPYEQAVALLREGVGRMLHAMTPWTDPQGA